MSDPATFRCGVVAIVGRPNVGKSTLLNALVGQKLSITSSKPQTTRHRIRAIKSTPQAQFIFVDTPGIHAAADSRLNQLMNKTAVTSLHEVDAVIFVVEVLIFNEEDARVFELVQASGKPFFTVANKIDRLKEKENLLPLLAHIQKRVGAEHDLIPVSARGGDNIDRLEALLLGVMPVGEPVFPLDQVTDHSMRFLAAEIVREKLMRRLNQELPYNLAVEIEQFKEEDNKLDISAVIWVERDGQKAIVIGKQGIVLKEVGTKARHDMERMFDQHVFLRLWVKVKEGWSDDARLLRSLGHNEE